MAQWEKLSCNGTRKPCRGVLNPGETHPSDTMPDRPNVVLILVDQWRGDCLSVCGHPVVYTPYIDQMALEGFRFSRAYSATPTCVPARAALYTGLTQRGHGRVGYQDLVPWNYPVTIADEFTRHGYQTQAVGKLHVYPERSQMGFQNVVLHDGFLHSTRSRRRNPELLDDYLPWLRQNLGRDADYFEHGLNVNSVVARPWDKPEHVHPTNFVVEQSIDFLRRRDPRKPFFLCMSFHRPHPPYDPPAWAFEQYLGQDMPDPPVGDWVEAFSEYSRVHHPSWFAGQIDARALHRARAGYYGHMTHIDQQVNRFMEALREFGQHESTYTCFTSDHGEMMGDHHLFRKGYPYEGSARVPLILKGPVESDVQLGGESHDTVVELRDIMPTLLDCVNVPIPDQVEGRSVLPVTRGESLSVREHLHGEQTMLGQSLQWITNGRDKYVWFSANGLEQLFDLETDPQETRDLSDQAGMQQRLKQMRGKLISELDNREENFTDGEHLFAGRPVVTCLSHLRKDVGLE